MAFNEILWSLETLEIMRKKLKDNGIRVHQTIADYTPFVKGKRAGSIKTAKIAHLATKDMPIIDADFYDNDDHSEIEITFDIEKGYPFLVGSIEQAQTNLNYRRVHESNAAEAILDAYDLSCLKEMVDSGMTSKTKITDTTTNQLAYADFLALYEALKETPRKERYVMVHPAIEHQLYKIAEFISIDKLGKATIPDGAIGRILGMTVLGNAPANLFDVSYAAGAYSATSAAKWVMAWSKLSVGFARQLELQAMAVNQPGSGKVQTNIFSTFGVEAQYNNYAAIRYETDIT